MQSESIPIFLYLNVDNHKAVSTELANYIVKHTDLLVSKPWRNFSKLEVSHVLEHVPLLKDFCEQKMLDPVFMAVTIMSPNGGEEMHADSDRPWVRILWPVINCVGSLTKLYHVSKNFYYEDNDKDISFVPFYFVKENIAVQQVGSFELRQPVVFDTSEFHSIHRVPNSIGPRISFSMGFDRDLDISNSMQAWLNF